MGCRHLLGGSRLLEPDLAFQWRTSFPTKPSSSSSLVPYFMTNVTTLSTSKEPERIARFLVPLRYFQHQAAVRSNLDRRRHCCTQYPKTPESWTFLPYQRHRQDLILLQIKLNKCKQEARLHVVVICSFRRHVRPTNTNVSAAVSNVLANSVGE